MIRGTTPIITFALPFDFDLVEKIWFTMAQRGQELFTKGKDDMEVNGPRVTIRLTQDDTLRLTPGQKVDVQVRILSTGKDAIASQIVHLEVDKILKDGVI